MPKPNWKSRWAEAECPGMRLPTRMLGGCLWQWGGKDRHPPPQSSLGTTERAQEGVREMMVHPHGLPSAGVGMAASTGAAGGEHGS